MEVDLDLLHTSSMTCELISLICFFYKSVLTPYYAEEVLFSLHDLEVPNEDGVSILFYLQKIFPGMYILMCLRCTSVCIDYQLVMDDY
ncbi:putative 1,3-beta-glucan synthase [Helianthus anomalus]